MKTFHTGISTLHCFTSLLAAVLLLGGQQLSNGADAPKSLVPVFGTAGADFNTKAKDGNVIKGWMPTGWNDNSEWAAVSATYSKLTDLPEKADKATGALRVKVEKVDEGQLQFTTYSGRQKYAKGKRYVVSGWIRSADRLSVNLGARQVSDPYEFYHEEELSGGTEWKRFEFAFTPAMEFEAFIMFVVREAGTVDLAGIAVEEKAKP
jgi:hypothetical protein